MTFRTYPGASNAAELQWPFIGQPAGILDDKTGNSLRATPSGSSPTTAVSPGKISVAGFYIDSDAVVTLDHSLGTQPASGQKRVDLIVARYDWSQPLSTAGSIVLKPGNPVALTADEAASAPTLQRDIGAICEEPIWRMARPSGGVPYISSELRFYSEQAVSPNYDDAPLGAIRTVGSRLQKRRLISGAPTWVTVADYAPPFQVFRQAENSPQPGGQWVYLPVNSPFGGRGQGILQAGVGNFLREFRVSQTGDFSLQWTCTFDRADVSMRILVNGDDVAQTDTDIFTAASLSKTLVVPFISMAAGSVISLQAYGANSSASFSSLTDSGSSNPAYPNKFTAALINWG